MGASSTAEFSVCDLKFLSTFFCGEQPWSRSLLHAVPRRWVIGGLRPWPDYSQSKLLFWILFSGFTLLFTASEVCRLSVLVFCFLFLNACLTNKGAEWWAVGICLISYWSSCWGHVQCRAGQEPAENSPWSDVLKPLGLSQCTALCSADCKLLGLLSSLWQINHCLSSCRGAQVGNVVAWKWTLVLTWWGLWDHYLILYTF